MDTSVQELFEDLRPGVPIGDLFPKDMNKNLTAIPGFYSSIFADLTERISDTITAFDEACEGPENV